MSEQFRGDSYTKTAVLAHLESFETAKAKINTKHRVRRDSTVNH